MQSVFAVTKQVILKNGASQERPLKRSLLDQRALEGLGRNLKELDI